MARKPSRMPPSPKPTTGDPGWTFRARFRRNSFGWRSAPAVARIKEALAEIRKASRSDPRRGAEGAVLFLERVAPAIEHVDGSSGSIGTAVHRAIEQLVPIIAAAPVDEAMRALWLERLDAACEADRMPYLESLGDHWGALCGGAALAGAWADRLLPGARIVLTPDRRGFAFFHGTSACLSALYAAGRYEELVALLEVPTTWSYKQWAARALVALGRRAEALAYAKACRSPYDGSSGWGVDAFCAEVLRDSGFGGEAFRHELAAPRPTTYAARFRAIVKQYPERAPAATLAELVASTPGAEGKWFAAAKQAGLLEEALDLASRSPCDPRTLARAARDFRETEPAFALGAAQLALRWIGEGHGYEITWADVRNVRAHLLDAAARLGRASDAEGLIAAVVAAAGPGAEFLRTSLGLSATGATPARSPDGR
jgi:hypothetical protein